MQPHILIVDAHGDPPPMAEKPLSAAWYRLASTTSAESAMAQVCAIRNLALAVVADDLPETSFDEMVGRLHNVAPGLPVIALTGKTAVPAVVGLMRSGARDVLVRPLMEVSLVTAVSRMYMERPRIPDEDLACRESQVFSLLGDGCSTSEIAARLGISCKTVDGTLIRLRAKMACSEVSGLRRLAVTRARQQAVEQVITTTIPVMGHDVIDAGHSGMLTQLCRVEQALHGGALNQDELSQATQALLARAHAHDQVEVALMRESGFPGLAEHQAEHAILLDEIRNMQARVAEGALAGAIAFRTFVLHWLGQHVQRFDRPVVAHLRQQAQPSLNRRAAGRRGASPTIPFDPMQARVM